MGNNIAFTHKYRRRLANGKVIWKLLGVACRVLTSGQSVPPGWKHQSWKPNSLKYILWSRPHHILRRRNLKMLLYFYGLLGLPSTLIRHENGAFEKRSSNQRSFKTRAFRFSVDGKHFENGAFRKRWRHDIHVISMTEFPSNTNPKCPVIVAFSNFSDVVWTENSWCVFRVRKLHDANMMYLFLTVRTTNISPPGSSVLQQCALWSWSGNCYIVGTRSRLASTPCWYSSNFNKFFCQLYVQRCQIKDWLQNYDEQFVLLREWSRRENRQKRSRNGRNTSLKET